MNYCKKHKENHRDIYGHGELQCMSCLDEHYDELMSNGRDQEEEINQELKKAQDIENEYLESINWALDRIVGES